MRLRPRNLNQALILLLGAVIVPLLLGALGLVVLQARQEQLQARAHLGVLAGSLVQTVDGELDNARSQLEVLAASRLLDELDWVGFHGYASEVARKKPGSVIGLARDDGQQILNTVSAWGSPQPNLWAIGAQQKEILWEGRSLPLSSQTLTRQVFERKVPVYSDLYYGLFLKRPALAISVPVERRGQVRYALTQSFPPARMEELIKAAVNDPGTRVSVVDRRGLVVASNRAAISRLADAMPRDHALPAGSAKGIYHVDSRDGTPLTIAYAVSTVNGFVVRVASPREAMFSVRRSSTAAWLGLVVAALLASLSMAGLIGRRISAPLRELAEAARSGRPAGAVDSSMQEITHLAAAVEIGAQSERDRVEERVRSAQQAEAEIALRKASKQKDEFLATLAHELRNPLAPIRSAAELIRRCAPTDARVQRARDIIERQVTHMTRLVDDLMDVSRITLGTVHLRQEPVAIDQIALDAAETLRPGIEAANVELRLLVDEAPVVGDPTRLTQCIVNLLNNAIKFTPEGGTITLRVRREGARARVEVEDTGIGIAAGSLERIFEPFVQERPTGSGGNTGLGIGLALTRRLVALHGGHVKADSDGVGRGSRFTIDLPQSRSHLSRAPLSSPRGGESLQAPAIDHGMRVVVVDDNSDAADMLAEMMASVGFATEVVYTGEDVVPAVARHRADAVLLDIGLPDIDGYEVCRRIKLHRPGLVVVALTGWGADADKRKAEAAGFDAHLTKPADPMQVTALLHSLITKNG